MSQRLSAPVPMLIKSIDPNIDFDYSPDIVETVGISSEYVNSPILD